MPFAVCEIRTVWSFGSKRAVRAHEVEQVRHLLEVGRDVRVVPPEVDVVEDDVDDVLDLCVGRLQLAAVRCRGYRRLGSALRLRRSETGCDETGENEHGQSE